jgi:hypothetical protein
MPELNPAQAAKQARRDRRSRQLRAWLRRQALIARIKGDARAADAWHHAATDEVAFEALAADTDGLATADGLDGAPFENFLAWLWENREAILAFALKLFDLFTANEAGK